MDQSFYGKHIDCFGHQRRTIKSDQRNRGILSSRIANSGSIEWMAQNSSDGRNCTSIIYGPEVFDLLCKEERSETIVGIIRRTLESGRSSGQ